MDTLNIVKKIYELRSSFVIIGLTGKTGSGCSSVAKLLNSSDTQFNPPLPTVDARGVSNDERKEQIIYQYLFFPGRWQKFTIIKASDIIMFYVLLNKFECFLCKFKQENHSAIKEKFEEDFKSLSLKIKEADEYIEKRESHNLLKLDSDKKEEEQKKAEKIRDIILKDLPDFIQRLNSMLKEKYKKKLYKELQEWGNNIRRYNSSIVPDDKVNCEDAPSCLAIKMNKIIKLIRDVNRVTNTKTYIVLDALRNPYEILFFRERYSAFYIMSVNTSEDIRRRNLINIKFRGDEIEELDAKESPKEIALDDSFSSQDIQKCIELSDIHIVTDGSPLERNINLKKQLMHYVCLMLHPGIIPPSPIERIMQVAFTAKLNSGCLSRQVGAAITDENFSIKAIGWNTTPQGQTPCSLRSFEYLAAYHDKSAFSDYEYRNSDFRNVVDKLKEKYNSVSASKKIDGLTLSYCFKDLHNRIKGDDNQVHTRSLHAEENAFLQLAKYGGNGIIGGKLFTTASPCVLCAKKAYQLGIKEIYYIDAYPDISVQHIFNCGINGPKSILFQGTIGRAYYNLYYPILPLKDEIASLTSIRVKRDISLVKEENDGKK